MKRIRLWCAPLFALALAPFLPVVSADLSNQEILVDSRTPKSIAIVGGGSAGLAVLKTLLDLPYEVRKSWEIVLYEERRNIGGVWLPDLKDPHPPDLPETPLYPALRTNTPNPLMTYPHFPFRPMTPVFPSHEYVEQYHDDFASHFGLMPYINLNTSVVKSSWVGNATAGKWNITVQRQGVKAQTHKLFDHLVVANGHNRYPQIPTWPGQEAWLEGSGEAGLKREILHSVYWRNATKYDGRSVLVVGGGASGRDVALHTAPVANNLYLSLKDDRAPRRLPVPVIFKPEISHFTREEVVFVDGTSSSDIDSVVLATGYQFRVPFLTEGRTLTVDPSADSCPADPNCLTTNLRYVFPLHEHIFSLAAAYPSTALAFVGLPMLVANCPSDVAQALLVAHAIADAALLPPRAQMLAQLRAKEVRMRERGLDPYRVGHRLVDIDEGQGPDGRMPDMAHDYQDEIVQYLKEHGALPNDGKPFVEEWRRRGRNESEVLWRAWEHVEELGENAVRKWLEGVTTEDEWADLLKRLVDWEQQQVRLNSSYEPRTYQSNRCDGLTPAPAVE